MIGFFEDEQIVEQKSDCDKCKLFQSCNSPKMKPTGKGKRKILVIAEAPGKTEDEKGEQLIGQAGQLLRKELKRNGIDLDRDCWKTNAVICRPPKNRTPTKKEIKCCNPKLIETIKKKKPKLIILLGGVALESFLMNKFPGATGGINKWRGFIIPDQEYKSWVMSTFHPSYLLRSQGITAIENTFSDDLKKAMDFIDKEIPDYTKNNICIYEKTNKELLSLLNGIIIKSKEKEQLLAFDYETTGIKPYNEGHKIICCAFCVDGKVAYVFKLDKKNKVYWKKILKNKQIKKTAHNLKFEHQWSREVLGVVVKRWSWDSMIAAHVIDNRQGITGLKFQTYVNFGQQDYSSHLEKYLRTEKGTEFNKVDDASIRELMEYCGMDALLQYRLAKKQMREINEQGI